MKLVEVLRKALKSVEHFNIVKGSAKHVEVEKIRIVDDDLHFTVSIAETIDDKLICRDIKCKLSESAIQVVSEKVGEL